MGYFLAIDIPDAVVPALENFILPDNEHVYKQRREDLHITLAYIGPIDSAQKKALCAALEKISMNDFSIEGRGAKYFGPGPGYRNHFLTADIVLSPALANLKSEIDAACMETGLEPRRHRNQYNPHITLGRADLKLEQGDIESFIAVNADKTLPRFTVSHFSLYKSQHPKPYQKQCEFALNTH